MIPPHCLVYTVALLLLGLGLNRLRREHGHGRPGLRPWRIAWNNLDAVRAIALIATGLLTALA